MLEGFKTIVIQNKVQSLPRAVLSNGALTINKSAITLIVDKGFIEVGVDPKSGQICICESGKTAASMPIKIQSYKRFSSKDFVRLVSKFVKNFEENKRYYIPVEANNGYLILFFSDAEVSE